MRWKLAHDDHAIERVSLIFQFKEPLPSKPWRSMLATASEFFPQKGLLEGNKEFASQIIVSPGGQQGPGAPNAKHVVTPQLSGWTFRAVTGAKVNEEISLRRVQFVYATMLYDRWSNFRQRVIDLLWPSLEQALQLVELDFVKLEYWDRFNFMGPPSEANYRELLRLNSKYIPSFPLDETNLWHSHIGFFADPGTSTRRLINLNVDVLDIATPELPKDNGPPVQRSVGIYTMAQDTVAQERLSNSASDLESTLDEMHTILKELLADVITDETANRISLKTQTVP